MHIEPTLYIVVEKAAPGLCWRGRTRRVGETVSILPANRMEERKLARYLAAGLMRVATWAEAERAAGRLSHAHEADVDIPAVASGNWGDADKPGLGRHRMKEGCGRQAAAASRCGVRIMGLQAEISQAKSYVRVRCHPRPDFGYMVLLLREVRGLTRTQFAARCGCQPPSITQIEYRKKASPRLSTVEKVAAGLGVKAWELVAVYEEFKATWSATCTGGLHDPMARSRAHVQKLVSPVSNDPLHRTFSE